MSERKVLNKYYPPDFDPSKIPRMKLARNRQYTVRLMAPFNMRCKTCGEYIYKGKKFNARKEDVEGDDYLGIRIYRFYIKCTRCLQEISFKTDPKNTDYEIEAGATRNFMALKLAEEQAQREEDEEKEEEATNPMKLLEKRTQQSKQELELLESLEELKDLNRRLLQAIDLEEMLEQFNTPKQRLEKEQEELDEQYIKSVFGNKNQKRIVVEEEIVELDEKESSPPKKMFKTKVKDKESNNLDSREDSSEFKETIDTNLSGPSTSTNTTVKSSIFLKDTKASFNKKNLVIVKKKASLGVKTNSDTISEKEVSEKTVMLPEINSKSDEIKANDNFENTVPTSNNIGNGLSLLTEYSDSSDNDSN
ncbi:splicing factor YJU2 [Vespa crabro]|uniref:splicing factor YJU2 n=1 Tax=Vespa crabro TaxID=7445 RepID=UPI001F0086AC|nr:splicing factor YJU2 [Vespa crabro]XP_046827362.1 splicing factor YJU2 [Vespa crabro]